MRGLLLAPVLVLGLVVATGPARGADEPAETTPVRTSPGPVQFEPTSAPGPGSSESGADEFEGLPGRDDPEEFYKKPPRKPKQKTRMHA